MLIKIYRFYNLVLRHLRQKWELRKVLSHKNEIYIGGPTSLSRNTILSKNPNFNGLKILGTGRVTFGDNFHSGTDCQIITSYHNYDKGDALPYDNTNITRDVTIGNNVWLGNNVIILSGVTLGEGSIIQAGAVVVSDIPKFAIAGGNPAKVFKYRDIKHYNKLLKLGKYN